MLRIAASRTTLSGLREILGKNRAKQGRSKECTEVLAGRAVPLFSEDAIAVIHQASRGYPRMVNNIALAALISTQASKGAIVDQSAAQSEVTEFTE